MSFDKVLLQFYLELVFDGLIRNQIVFELLEFKAELVLILQRLYVLLILDREFSELTEGLINVEVVFKILEQLLCDCLQLLIKVQFLDK